MKHKKIFIPMISVCICITLIILLFSNKNNKGNIEQSEDIIFNSNQLKLQNQMFEIEELINFKNHLNNFYQQNILMASISQEELNQLTEEFNNLNSAYQQLLINDINNVQNQYLAINDFKQSIRNLFSDNDMTLVNQNINRNQLTEVQKKLNNLPQQSLKEEYQPYLSTILMAIEEQEKKAEEERIAAIETERKRKEEEQNRINNAYIELKNITYVSQNEQQIYNGCEAASILMGLKYKGYLTNTTLKQIVQSMPISNDPHKGFVRSIFDKEPSDVPHWIAPDALTKFAIEYSGYNNIIDITGASTDQLKAEINNDNPVVVYITYRFNTPTNWTEEMPKNLHVVLLTGYNSITGNYIIQDPYTPSNGIGRMIIDKNTFESVYNRLNRNAIVIR